MAVAEISAIITGIKETMAIVKGLKPSDKIKTISQIQTDTLIKLSDIVSRAITLQEQHSALLNEKEELAKKIQEFENWSDTERNYELTEIAHQRFVYRSKKSDQSTEPPHYICPDCYQERKKSILQDTGAPIGFSCHRCKSHFHAPDNDRQVWFTR